jgi:serine/threonine protein kinase
VGSSETLRSVIDAGRTAKRLDELSTARVICKIAEQVHAAQQKAGAGKAIGPITPAGITIDPAGAAKLGLAEPTATAYSSPEQVAGGGGDRRSDVFSLGAVMWEALTHEQLFEGDSKLALEAAVKDQAIVSPAELNANIPAELGAICMKALARAPSDRYQSAKVMAAEIEAVLDDAGYADTDDKIAEYIATLGQPRQEKKVTLPPVGVANAVPTATTDRTTQPEWPPIETARQPAKTEPPPTLPSILDKPPTAPPAAMSAPSAGSLSPTSFLKSDKPGAHRVR